MMPKVTVLMSVYNGEKYLREAMESILNQTFGDFEFLIINDASTDTSKEIILSYADLRIVYVENEINLGLTKSLNEGLKLVKGEYVARMDDDDISLPMRLEKQVQFMDNNPDVGVCGTWFKLFPSGELVERPVTNDEIRLHLFRDNALGHPTVMLRVEVLKWNNFYYNPEYTYAQDYELWTRLMQKTKMHNIPEVLLKYRVHETQICKVHTGRQGNLVNVNRLAQLQYLGIVPTEREKDLHLGMVVGSIQIKADISESSSWIDKLIFANTQRKIYPEEEFSNMLRKCLEKTRENENVTMGQRVEDFLKNIILWKKR